MNSQEQIKEEKALRLREEALIIENSELYKWKSDLLVPGQKLIATHKDLLIPILLIQQNGLGLLARVK
ncbi:13090_t:CDS:2 [Racocetra fulgida]|uniref:13090_t:CDS:1 n=1 Tax=Racocetra fulgida TaxID=60492 RepID=A0A9N8W324_9GLOM|nr:13090_t:CDS:2 [Racocetra fulgida]